MTNSGSRVFNSVLLPPRAIGRRRMRPGTDCGRVTTATSTEPAPKSSVGGQRFRRAVDGRAKLPSNMSEQFRFIRPGSWPQKPRQRIKNPFARITGTIGIQQRGETEGPHVHRPISPAAGLGALVDGAGRVIAGRHKGTVQPAGFHPKPDLPAERGQLFKHLHERRTRGRRASRAEFKRHAGVMVPSRLGQPGQILRRFQPSQSSMPFQTAPVVLPESREDSVPARQLCFGQVPPHKIRVFGRPCRALQSFPGKQQSGAAIQ